MAAAVVGGELVTQQELVELEVHQMAVLVDKVVTIIIILAVQLVELEVQQFLDLVHMVLEEVEVREVQMELALDLQEEQIQEMEQMGLDIVLMVQTADLV
jgi:hypothetical protein